VIVLAIWLWRRYGNPGVISELVESVVPDEFDDVAEYLVALAVSAVEQRIKAYQTLTNAERLALAKKYATALLDYAGRDLSDLALEALIEAELWLRHQVIEAPAPAPAAQPTVITTTETTMTPATVIEQQPETITNWAETVNAAPQDNDFLRGLEGKPLGG